MIDVYDFCNLCTDDSIEITIYDFYGEEEVFRGTMREAQDSSWEAYDVESFDLTPYGMIILNIDTEDND